MSTHPSECPGAGYIDDWGAIPDGSIVIEDCWPEVYQIFTRENKRWLRQIGWQLPPGRTKALPESVEREIDFDPQPYMDQPWIYLPRQTPEDYRGTVA